MKEVAQKKAEALTRAITTDPRWDLQDELMCQVFGYTVFGYLFGVGRLTCFMDVEDILQLAVAQLTGLGIGPQYADGLMRHAFGIFTHENDESLHSQLIGIGHSHFASPETSVLVDAIFSNTEKIRAIS
ncbi:MAG: hypothetical protein AAGM22_12110 [Acidobacteriota bacterium]